ncbi:MAG TPA: metalloprotease PmbA [Gammaproteobacteria bacterium]|nr:metalloprotease PmbA [Gammaproteobacteria bacterium]HDH16093.1 metalloprotease PmbA [Gammaproteobacteria bacterium]HDZ77786.1 metalloprotease PmbA [Gammaproteobacteria bacterium]
MEPDIQDIADPLQDVVEQVLAAASHSGASSAEVDASLSQGSSLTVRLGEIETIEHNRDKSLSLTVFFGKKSGSASTSDMTADGIRHTVDAACSIAKLTAEDDCGGLADADRMATEFPELDLWYPWNPDTGTARDLALQCEEVARQMGDAISNSEGATVSSHEGVGIYANTHGFNGMRYGSRHSLSCSVIASEGEEMERDYWYSEARDRTEMQSAEEVGRIAGQRALDRLGSRKIATCKTPVIYEAQVAGSLLSHLISAISGGALYRKSSFLLDHKGKKIFPEHINISENPHIPKALGSAAFDNEGVATKQRSIIKDGILMDYVLSSYSARKLGLLTTGNAGGVHNLMIKHGDKDLSALLKQMDTGLFVTELIGFGINNVTGDYSRGAAGFWVENGEIQYPVSEVTVAGNLLDMFQNFVEIGNDLDKRGNIITGSILLEQITVAGE